jgi:caa(3)-type oxidase subunit IV
MSQHSDNNKEHHHHILPYSLIFGIGTALLVLTVVTVLVAKVDLGRLNFVVAMAVASIKASLVALFFMNLWYDKKENGVMFASSFLFLAIFVVLCSTDLYFRGDVYVKGAIAMPTGSSKSNLKDPWISTPDLVEKGKTIFAGQCVACHGANGEGNGPAAASLNPPPRNFHQSAGWKNGRKVSMIFKTLKEGIPGSAMASFATLASDDRWALTHYVISLNSAPVDKDSPEDFKKAGIDTSGKGEVVDPVIPVELAIERLAVTDPAEAGAHLYQEPSATVEGASAPSAGESSGARVYASSCVQCHGANGEGGIKVRNLGVWPNAYLTTRPFSSYASLSSADAFNRVVIRGIPGEVMPGNGQLSGAELRDLYTYVKGLRGK